MLPIEVVSIESIYPIGLIVDGLLIVGFPHRDPSIKIIIIPIQTPIGGLHPSFHLVYCFPIGPIIYR